MKTLQSIFHRKILKNYVMIFLVTLAGLLISIYSSDLKKDSDFMTMVYGLSFFIAFVGPLSLFFFNKSFGSNIKYLINQHFNRLELIKFYLFSQTLKVFLISLNYLVLLGILNLLSKSEWGLDSYSLNFYFSSYTYYFTTFISFIFLIYGTGLFGANIQEIQRMNVAKSIQKKQTKKIVAIFIFMFIGLHIANRDDFPFFLGLVFWSLFVMWSTLGVFNRSFKLFSKKKGEIFEYGGAILAITPFIALYFGIKQQVHNPEISFKDRADGINDKKTLYTITK